MKINSLAVPAVILSLSSMFFAAESNAALVTLINNNTAGQSWNTTTAWSNGLAPASTNDYLVGMNGSASRLARTPSSGSSIFGGNSLTLSGGALNLSIQAASASRTVTVSDLRMTNGAVLINGIGSSDLTRAIQYLEGNLELTNGTANYNVIRTGGTAGPQGSTSGQRFVAINSKISGSGTTRLIGNGAVILGNSGNTYSGVWRAGGSFTANDPSGPIVLNNNPANVPAGTGPLYYQNTMLQASVAGSLSSAASVYLDLYSSLKLDYDWTTSGSLTLALNDTGYANAITMELDQNITVGSFSIAGNSFAAGTYTYADLAPLYADYFSGGSGFTGSITVVPEPEILGLLLLGGLVISLQRCKSRWAKLDESAS